MNTQIVSTGSQPCHFDLFLPEALTHLPKDRLPTEHEEQRSFVSLWRKCNLPRIYAIPNGEARGIKAAMRLKVEGVSRGVPDLHCPEWRLWIEFKRQKGGSVSVDQKAWHKYLTEIGDIVLVCKGAVQGVNLVREVVNLTIVKEV